MTSARERDGGAVLRGRLVTGGSVVEDGVVAVLDDRIGYAGPAAGFAGDLYGVPVDSTMEAMALGAQLEAMITDPVYEGKSMAGLVDLVTSGEIPSDSTVLYAHLGGQPALNGYSALFS